MVFVPRFYDCHVLMEKKTRSDGEENSSGTAKENVQGESILDMELDMDGELKRKALMYLRPFSRADGYSS